MQIRQGRHRLGASSGPPGELPRCRTWVVKEESGCWEVKGRERGGNLNWGRGGELEGWEDGRHERREETVCWWGGRQVLVVQVGSRARSWLTPCLVDSSAEQAGVLVGKGVTSVADL